jgi:hypothetical protein
MGEMRRPGNDRTCEYGNTIQNPLDTMSAISTRRKTWCSCVEAWLPRAIASSRRWRDQGSVVRTTGAPCWPKCCSRRRAGCGNLEIPGLALEGALLFWIKVAQVSLEFEGLEYACALTMICLPSSSNSLLRWLSGRWRFAGGESNGTFVGGGRDGMRGRGFGGLGGSSASSWRGPTPQLGGTAGPLAAAMVPQ